MSLYTRPEEIRRERIEAVLGTVLAGDRYVLKPLHFTVRENLERGVSEVACSYLCGEEEVEVTSTGAGFVDALFSGLLKIYAGIFKSLSNICFTSFSVRAGLDSVSAPSGSDAYATVLLETRPSEKGAPISAFRTEAKSINVAAATVVFEAIQFYINCELAFRRLQHLISEAKSRSRGDIVSSYISKLVEIVNVSACDRCE
jgi:hypothetical protein